MKNQELLDNIEAKKAELAQLIEKQGLTSEQVLSAEKEVDKLVALHLRQFIETTH